MKKLGLLVVSLLLLPFIVSAASLPSVKTLDASTSGLTIKYNGTMEDGSYAVMCKLYDSDSNEIDLLSTSVSEKAFEGTFEVASAGKYTITCANYEGGAIKSVEVEVKEEVKENTPNTFDNISLIVIYKKKAK